MTSKMKWDQLAAEIDRNAATRIGFGNVGCGGTRDDDESTTAVWTVTSQRVHALTWHLFPTLHEEDREEIAQEVLLLLATPAGSHALATCRSPHAYIYSVARNKGFDYIRSQKRERETSDAFALLAPCDIPASADMDHQTVEARVARLDSELEKLPEADRALLMARFVEKKAITTLAAERGLKYSAVATRLFRLVHRLRSRLQLNGLE
jgi:RNA polymerase sigma factor (sigma-70 family)